MKMLNIGDILLIAFSSYVIVWGINYGLRMASVPEFQA